MQPFRLNPVFKEYLWGGTKLITQFSKAFDGPVLAESWELCAHSAGSSVVADGPLQGKTLLELSESQGIALFGTALERFQSFPVMIKLIDAKKDLSVQVHPDDAFARRVENDSGKTEMWYILSAEPGAFLYFGFKRRLSREEFLKAAQDGSITESLNKVYVKPGDVLFIKAGTVHAIGAGILLAEIQQNSNTTYRVYDYHRTDAGGKPRELHLEKAAEVADLNPCPAKPLPPKTLWVQNGSELQRLAECPYFQACCLLLSGEAVLCADNRSFHSLLCVDGEAELCAGDYRAQLKKGDSYLLPAGTGEYRLEGRARLLVTSIE